MSLEESVSLSEVRSAKTEKKFAESSFVITNSVLSDALFVQRILIDTNKELLERIKVLEGKIE